MRRRDPRSSRVAVSVADGRFARRALLARLGALGLGATAFPAALLAAAQDAPAITAAMIEQAEKLAGLSFTDAQRREMERGLNEHLATFARLRTRPLDNQVPPCTYFDPLPPGRARPAPSPRRVKLPPAPALEAPVDVEELSFASVWALSELVRTRAVTSLELTEMYLERLKRHDPRLLCVVTLLEDQALTAARRVDEEIASGFWRGPLHGIPWGAKDLLHTRGTITTYGAEPFRDFVPDDDAAVVERLRNAGAILIAKLTLGALAMGDVWFGGMTRNPWNVKQGSSGSSAGPAAATAAGLVPFSIGSETLGSIVSPSTRCGTTGLRPTFGRVSRAGSMALSWSMDKLGPICRSALDCALVFAAIEGRDERDRSTVDLGFDFDATEPLSQIRIGWLKPHFTQVGGGADRHVLDVLRAQGAELEPIELPGRDADDLALMLSVEAASAFDDLTRSGGVDRLREQGPGAWPNQFRTARMVPAVEYLRASRLRTLLLEDVARAFDGFDVVVAPTFGGNVLTLTNLTGHPALVMPNGFAKDGTPTSITLIGRLYGEAELLRVGHAFQAATDLHLRVPEEFAV
jgi:Asp-tRNA(Asn)/Glu-tRNA(Gln) amidotransferase A subunit family amidase